jgi:hypothetical protein
MSIFRIIEARIIPYSNGLLMILAIGFIFLTPFFPVSLQKVVGQLFFSLIFFIAIFTLDTGRKTLWVIAVVAFITEWLSYWIDMPVVNYISTLINILFFQVIVIKLLIQIAKSKNSDAGIIFEAINGYLMMGLMFTSWVAVAMAYDPGSFNFYTENPIAFDYSYFTFVTMTTLGYGDVTPQLPFARSIAVLISTAGQMYVAVIIAMLVGKYAGAGSKEG